ncbi:peptidase S12 [Streptomyces solincola]|uniref:Peptidase S12 n=1 Tax=Streptomyces solincola TaxID=2100817 RepID=A0A2S9PV92_9ACTN|nr:serine hydrolase domain-containing protein [Streptomyces solincola]PRH78283.1 peptidase S12 [Streptomyces solincola]
MLLSPRSLVRAGARRRPVRPAVALLTAAAALAATAVAAAPAPAGPQDDALRGKLEALVRTAGGPPGVITVLQRDGERRVLTAGTAELGTDRRPSPGDAMRLASASKMYSGAVSLQLVEQGELRLDDTLGRVLPRLPKAWAKVTLRQLLNHTSGLPDYTTDAEFQRLVLADPRRRFDSRRLLDFVADQPLGFTPGSRYRYSNSDNIAVALMAEAVTGRPYEELLDRLVYRPLDLRETVLPSGYRLREPYLHGYEVDPPAAPEDLSEVLSASGVWASGGLVATPRDFHRFVRGYAGGALVSGKARAAQYTFREGASEPAGPGVNATGLALFRYTTRCGTVYGHTGNFPGYTQFAAATKDGKRSLTFSISTQTNKTLKPALLAKVRAVQEDAVCAVLR